MKIKKLASVKMAVAIILGLVVITAIGTVVESNYDAVTAQKWVYSSVWMTALLIMLAVNITAVMIDRWPWKKKHIPFLLAHVGILILLIGSFLTRSQGFDGLMTVKEGETDHIAVVPSEVSFAVYFSTKGKEHDKIYSGTVKRGPVAVSGEFLEIEEYLPFARSEVSLVSSDSKSDGMGLNFEITNSKIEASRSMIAVAAESTARTKLGPLEVVLTRQPQNIKSEGHQIVIAAKENFPLPYSILEFGKLKKSGRLKLGETVETGWMAFKFKVTQYFPHAMEVQNFMTLDKPDESSTSAIKFKFNGKTQWLGLDQFAKVESPRGEYVISFTRDRRDLGFDLRLDKFSVKMDPGTQHAASYESRVTVPGYGQHLISMNEPLSYKGLTLYQSGFESDENDQPIASTFAVNFDPGRSLKYVGALMIVLGILALFYSRHIYR